VLSPSPPRGSCTFHSDNDNRRNKALSGGCIFCDIAQGRTQAPIVFEDADSLAFLDHRPVFPGHVLLIPKAHVETLPELPISQGGAFLGNVQLLCASVEEAMNAQGTFVGVNNKVSQSVPHLHVHIVPRRRGDGLRGFFWPRRRYQNDVELSETRDRISQAAIRRAEASVKRKT